MRFVVADAAALDGRHLIVNADDFGRSPGINRGVVRAHREGIVTSASLMVRWPAAAEAARLAAEHPELSLGLHLDLGEWVYRDGTWATVYEVAPADDERAVRVEVARQLDRFHELVGRAPTHVDSHQHVHRRGPPATVLAEVCEDLGIPLRHRSAGVRYRGDFFGQSSEGVSQPELIGVAHLVAVLRAVPPGITELACHPGEAGDCGSAYRNERARELESLCDPRVIETLEEEGIRLASFLHVRPARGASARSAASAVGAGP